MSRYPRTNTFAASFGPGPITPAVKWIIWANIGAFLLTFGIWDITYYVALYAILRWPPSLATMDVLFLIPPGPWWHQPVWVPVAISCGMIALGARLFLGRSTARR